MKTLPVSAVVPTRNRLAALRKTLMSLKTQFVVPAELIVVDASDDFRTRDMLARFGEHVGPNCTVKWLAADLRGAAAQRNQGVSAATQSAIWFFDDDILFEPECISRLWTAFLSSPDIGGASAMITNQRYQNPGVVSRLVFRALDGGHENYAGKVIGPAIHFLPEDSEDLPEVVPVEWLNTTCTLYHREALPDPPFAIHFTGYSLMEDLALSLTVGKRWKLINARTARIFHDSQPGSHKSDPVEIARMALINRHYVARQVLGQRGVSYCWRLLVWELFQLASATYTSTSISSLGPSIRGKLLGLRDILLS